MTDVSQVPTPHSGFWRWVEFRDYDFELILRFRFRGIR